VRKRRHAERLRPGRRHYRALIAGLFSRTGDYTVQLADYDENALQRAMQ